MWLERGKEVKLSPPYQPRVYYLLNLSIVLSATFCAIKGITRKKYRILAVLLWLLQLVESLMDSTLEACKNKISQKLVCKALAATKREPPKVSVTVRNYYSYTNDDDDAFDTQTESETEEFPIDHWED